MTTKLIYTEKMSAADFCAANNLKNMKTFKEVCEFYGFTVGSASARVVLLKNINLASEPTAAENKPTNEPTNEPTTAPEIKTPKLKNDSNNLAALIGQAVSQYINVDSAPQLDNEQIIELIKLHAAPRIETLYINRETKKEVKIELKHKQFNDILALISCGLNVWINGGAGGGKTHIVSQVAEILDLPFYSKSISAQTSEFSLLGFMNAAGNFVETDFYKAYTTGGVFCLDEIDNGNPNVLAVLNSALSNGHCSFANGGQTKHKDFILIATANTIGKGATAQYVGRLAIDGATLDRFVMINLNYDNNLEAALCGNKEVSDAVQTLREKAEKHSLNCIISPRASINAAKLMAAGLTLKKALDFCIFNKLTDNETNILSN
jgi:cobaltochelatase CobS